MLIFSVFNNQSLDNNASHNDVKKYLAAKGIAFREMLGMYNGSQELSLAVNDLYRDTVEMLADLYSQESILWVNGINGQAILEYANGTKVNLGTFQRIPKQDLRDYKSYSIDLNTNVAYIVK